MQQTQSLDALRLKAQKLAEMKAQMKALAEELENSTEPLVQVYRAQLEGIQQAAQPVVAEIAEAEQAIKDWKARVKDLDAKLAAFKKDVQQVKREAHEMGVTDESVMRTKLSDKGELVTVRIDATPKAESNGTKAP